MKNKNSFYVFAFFLTLIVIQPVEIKGTSNSQINYNSEANFCNWDVWTWTTYESESYKTGEQLAIGTSENRWVHLGWEQFGNDPIDYWIIDQGTGTNPSVNVPSEATYSCL